KKILNFKLKHKLFFLLLFLISYEYKPLSIPIGTSSITLLLTSLIEDYILERKRVSFLEKIIANIGLVSYSIYLFHEPLLEWLKMLINKYFDANFQYSQHPYFTCTLGATIIFIPILLISWLSYKYVEMPTHRLGKSISQYISFGTLMDSRVK
ncbi:MAG: hypothetical protein PUP92_21980, partial [Rhizonema sp. PD38]|nr:hypothetical protein [Rhizonema sp. PD38]